METTGMLLTTLLKNTSEMNLGNRAAVRRVKILLSAMLAGLLAVGLSDDDQRLRQVYTALRNRDYDTVRTILTEEADKGNPKAQLILGKMLLEGKIVPPDQLRGIVLIRKAAEQNLPDAQYQLALAYRDGKGTGKNPEESFSWCQRAADQNHVKAQCLLGIMLRTGSGCPRDPGEAVFRFRQAAARGNADSMFMLGQMYENGEGIPEDRQKAERYFRQAAAAGHQRAGIALRRFAKKQSEHEKAEEYFKQSENNFKSGDVRTALSQLELSASLGYAPAQQKLGIFHLKKMLLDNPDPEKGARLIGKAAEQGFASAQYLLARLYYEGKEIRQDHQRSFEWCSKAAAQKYPQAVALLGYFHRKGIGCIIDSEEAMALFRQGIELGDAECLFQLAEMYRLGEGIEENQDEAKRYYRQAAAKGHKTARQYLDELYGVQRGNSSPIRQMNSLDQLRMAASRGDAESQYQMALAYRNGTGGAIQTSSSSFYWCRKAADQGHSKAMGLLGIMYRTGFGCSPDSRQAFRFFSLAAERGDVESIFQQGEMYRLGEGTGQNAGMAAAMFELAARKGHAEGAFRTAEMYRRGEGVPFDMNKAVSYYRQAAGQGHTGAIQWISENRHLAGGSGPEPPVSVSAKRKISPRAEAAYQTALAYRDGRLGYSINLKKFFKQCRYAAEHGHPEAQYQLGIMYRTGFACTRNYHEALKWISLAAAQGHVESLYVKGEMYMLGQGLSRPDLANAAEIFKLAARKGHRKAQMELQNLKQATLTE